MGLLRPTSAILLLERGGSIQERGIGSGVNCCCWGPLLLPLNHPLVHPNPFHELPINCPIHHLPWIGGTPRWFWCVHWASNHFCWWLLYMWWQCNICTFAASFMREDHGICCCQCPIGLSRKSSIICDKSDWVCPSQWPASWAALF